MNDKAQPSPESDALTEIRAELREIKSLLTDRNARAGDLVDASYVARRTGLAEKTVMERKAGTSALPRIHLGRRVMYRRGAVDKFVEDLASKAVAKSTPLRVQRLLSKRQSKGQRRVA